MKILIDEEVLKQALDALSSLIFSTPYAGKYGDAITALRSALQADTKVEPTVECVTSSEPYCWMLDTAEPIGTTPVSFTYQPKWGFTFPLYAAPTPPTNTDELLKQQSISSKLVDDLAECQKDKETWRQKTIEVLLELGELQREIRG